MVLTYQLMILLTVQVVQTQISLNDILDVNVKFTTVNSGKPNEKLEAVIDIKLKKFNNGNMVSQSLKQCKMYIEKSGDIKTIQDADQSNVIKEVKNQVIQQLSAKSQYVSNGIVDQNNIDNLFNQFTNSFMIQFGFDPNVYPYHMKATGSLRYIRILNYYMALDNQSKILI